MKIKSTRVYVTGNFIPCVLDIEGKTIKQILPYDTEADVDYKDLRIVPGFIDIHCHGAYGYDTNDGEPEGLKKWTKNIVQEGVVGFMNVW